MTWVINMDKVIYERWGTPVHIAKRNNLEFVPHLHDEVELIFIKKGPFTAYIDDCQYTLNDGCLLVIFPNQLHSYVDIKDKYDLVNYMMIFKSDVLKIFSAEFDKIVPESPIITDKNVLKEIESLLEKSLEIRKKEPEYMYQALNAHATLILQLALPYFKHKKAKKLQKDIVADIFAYCNRNFCEDITLDDISKEINISKEHIMRIFRERFHTNFRAYINHLRIDEAKKLLRETDISITDISINVGYNTIRTFNRVFIENTGITPTQYRQNLHLSPKTH